MTEHQTKKTAQQTFGQALARQLLATTALTVAGLMFSAPVMADPGNFELPNTNAGGNGFTTPTYTTTIDGTLNFNKNGTGAAGPYDTGSGLNKKNNLDINQTSNRAVINWNTFNIGKKGVVNFNQDSASNVTVNKVSSSGGIAQIYGQLNSNGKIMILDQNGVFFDAGSTINVGGIIASTGSLDSTNEALFLAGQRFSLTGTDLGGDTKTVENYGTINVADSGLLAFVAPNVKNGGTINAKLGKVTLGAGETATLDFYGDDLISVAVSGDLNKPLVEMTKDGKINANGGVVTLTTTTAKTTVDHVINMKGVITANNFSTKDGKIVLSGGGKVKVSGRLEAKNSGSDTDIDIRGKDVEISTDSNRGLLDILANGANGIYSNANGSNGNGGSVYIWGDNSVTYGGKIEVKGGSASGNGGDVEISSGNTLAYRGTVDASAAHGTRGTLTIDPDTITIGNSTVDPIVNAKALADTLGLTNVHMIAGSSITLVDNADLSHWNIVSVTDGDLILDAPTLNLNKNLKMGKGNLTLDADTVNLGGKLYRNNVPVVNLDAFNTLMSATSGLSGSASTVNVLGDTASIQQGIDIAKGDGTAKVYVAVGNYQENLNVYKSLTLQGQSSGGSIPLLFGVNPLGQVILVSADNVTIDGFNIVGVHAPWYMPHLYGIAASHVSGLKVTNNVFGEFIGSGVKLTDTQNSTVSGNTISVSGIGIDVSGGAGHTLANNTILTTGTGIHLADASDVSVSGNTITATLLNAIEAAGISFSDIVDNFITGAGGNGIIVDGGEELNVSGNTVAGALAGDAINVGHVDGLTVKSNVAGGAGDDAIDLHDVTDATVTLNATGLSTDNALELTNVDGATVSANLIGIVGNDGIHVENGKNLGIAANVIAAVEGDGIDLGNAQNAVVALNVITGAKGDGVKATSASDISVDGNVILGAGDNGVEIVDTTNATVLANVITNAGNDGVFVDPSTGSVSANIITGATHNGISVVDSDGFSVLGNVVSDSGAHGIFVDNSDLSVVSLNTVKNSGNDGIHVEDSSGNFVLANKSQDNKGNGISVSNGIITAVAGNTVSGSGLNGIRLADNEGALIAMNTVSGSTLNGILASNAGLSLITKNTVGTSGEDGVHVEDSIGNVVTDNTVSDNGGDGIEVTRGAGTLVSGNGVSGSGQNGINVSDHLGAIISENTVSGSALDGIRVINAALASISGNQVSTSGQDGIHAENSLMVWVDGNTVEGAGDDGIDVSEALGVRVTDNKVSYTDDNGIQAEDTLGARVEGNTVRHSGNDGIHAANSAGIDIVDNNLSRSEGDGIDVDGSDFADIKGNDVRHSDDNGIEVTDSKGVDVKRNDIDRSGENGIYADNADRIEIAGNDVDDSGRHGIAVFNAHHVDINDNEVSDSGFGGDEEYRTMDDNSGDGIHVENSRHVDITDNTVTNSADDGIDVSKGDEEEMGFAAFSDEEDDSDDINVSGNTVEDSGDNGIEVSDLSGVRVSDNTVEGSFNNGIYVVNGAHIDIRGNTLTNNGHVLSTMYADGWYLYSESYGYGDGIHVEDSEHVDIRDNTVSGSGNDGIDVGDSYRVNIKGNTVSDSHDNGVLVTDTDRVKISHNDISNSGHRNGYMWWTTGYGDGIHVDGGHGIKIRHNTVSDSEDDGIEVRGNDMRDLRVMSFDDEGDDDSIRISHNTVSDSGRNGIAVSYGNGVRISHNNVSDSGSNGIDVYESNRVRITGNDVYDSYYNGIAVGGGSDLDVLDNTVSGTNYSNGIHVYNVYGDVRVNDNTVSDIGYGNGISVWFTHGASIEGNTVSDGYGYGYNGIRVYGSPYAYIAGNDVSNFYNGISVWYGYGITIDNNDVYDVYNDGIQAYNVGGMMEPSLARTMEDDADVYDLVITNNRVNGYNDDGIQVAYSGDVLIGYNTVNAFSDKPVIDASLSRDSEEDSDTTGIRLGDNENEGCGPKGRCSDDKVLIAEVSFPMSFRDMSGNNRVDIIGNDVSNNATGLHARAFNNGSIALSGNTFTDNTIGAWIGSGLINLTGDSNTFSGGDVALRFERSMSTPFYPMPTFQISEDLPVVDEETDVEYADLSLVDDTLGTTIFEGQSTYYVELLNGAFFDPGKPTIIDGRFASFDGFIPGTGPIDNAKLEAIEAMIHDYDDDASVGQIFVGFSVNDLDDNDIMKRIAGYNFKQNRGGITILGLPRVGGGNGGFSVQDLANLAPAAGGDDEGHHQVTIQDLASMEPAAGGDDNGQNNGVVNGKCWGNLGHTLNHGQTAVNFSLSDDPSSILADQSGCQDL